MAYPIAEGAVTCVSRVQTKRMTRSEDFHHHVEPSHVEASRESPNMLLFDYGLSERRRTKRPGALNHPIAHSRGTAATFIALATTVFAFQVLGKRRGRATRPTPRWVFRLSGLAYGQVTLSLYCAKTPSVFPSQSQTCRSKWRGMPCVIGPK